MKIIELITKKSKINIALTLLCSLASVSFNLSVIHIINKVISGNFSIVTKEICYLYFILVVSAVVSSTISHRLLSKVGLNVARDLRAVLSAAVAGTNIQKIEDIGQDKLFAMLTQDVSRVADGVAVLPVVAINVFAMIGGVVYLIILSPSLFSLITIPLVLGFLGVKYFSYVMRINFSKVRENIDALYKNFRGLIVGAKELKLNSPFEEYFHKNILFHSINQVHDYGEKAQLAWVLSLNWKSFLFFGLIGFILMTPLYFEGVNTGILVGYVLVFLYLREPLTTLLYSISPLLQSNISIKKIESMQLDLRNIGAEEIDQETDYRFKDQFYELALESIEYAYPSASSDKSGCFALGPISLSICHSSITFLVGGNGSGKSTLGKLIAGIYKPSAGKIFLNGNEVNNEDNKLYRNHFSVVFSDYYLFDQIYHRKEDQKFYQRITSNLEYLGLDNVVDINKGEFSTVNKLSQGQRKRLALLVAYVSGRPIYIFDEWASDQDPIFKRFFYQKLLPELRSKGKTIIVITHDDQYFGVADFIYKLVDGRLFHE